MQAACAAALRRGAFAPDILLASEDLNEKQKRSLRTFCRDIALLPKDTAAHAIGRILHLMGYENYLEKRKLDARKAEIMQTLAQRERTVPAFLRRLETLRALIEQKTYDSACRLTLSTIHSAKGLEYDTVYLIDVFDGVLPENAIRVTRHTPPEDVERLEEDRRIFYVGITRAKKNLFIFQLQNAPSMFIDELRKSAAQKKTGEAVNGLTPIPQDWVPEVGATVYHHSYGRGVIAEQSSNGKYVTIRFLSGQIKTFDADVLRKNRLLYLYT